MRPRPLGGDARLSPRPRLFNSETLALVILLIVIAYFAGVATPRADDHQRLADDGPWAITDVRHEQVRIQAFMRRQEEASEREVEQIERESRQ